MTRLLIYMLPGVLLDILLLLANAFLVPEHIQASDWYNVFLPLLQIFAIVIPCVIYYIKMPPGQDTRP
ncbi:MULTISPECIES: hypothetical protein [unclassified Fibrobacter]|uniref:hypothetical protein n=1 Tax=unclassified Fibrobacter TaxID=2634177 RepID=UPI000D6D2467|nr:MULTISPECIES: hypothetical protein [unclassified Fibrobacter]